MQVQVLVAAAAAVLGLTALPSSAATNLLFNGDFEQSVGAVNNGGYTTVNAGETTIAGWTVGDRSVDLIRNNYGAINDVSVDLAGTPGPGSISQSFAVLQGLTYTLNFQYSTNSSSIPLDVTFGTLFQSYSLVGPFPANGSLSFVATQTGDATVKFASMTDGNNGAVVDNISVTAVPEPDSYVLALAAVGVLGGMAYRRKS